MINKSITTVEIKENSMTVAINKLVGKKQINLFFKTEKFNRSVSTSSGEITDINLVRKSLNKIFIKLENNPMWHEEIKDIICIVPSSTYSKKTCVKNTNFESHSRGTLFDDQTIEKNQATLIKNLKSKEGKEIINFDFTKIMLDNKEWVPNTNQTGKELSFHCCYELIDQNVYKTHVSLIKNMNKNILMFVPNMKALFSVDEFNSKKPQKCLIANWGHETFEIAYFKKDILKNHKLLNIGLNDVIETTANKLNIERNLCEKYIFENLDFNSRNALDNVVLKFNNKRLKKEYTGKEIRTSFLREIDLILKQALEIISLDLNIDVFKYPVFHHGVINSIPHIEKIFKNKISSANYFNKTNLIGSLNNNLLSPTIGVFNLVNFNEYAKTSNQSNDHKALNNLEFDLFTMGAESGYMQALFLKQDAIILENVISSEGK